MEAEWYYALIRDFLDGRISTAEFETRFFIAYKAEKLSMDRNVYRLLETVFGALDSYWEGWTPQDEQPPVRITEKTLRKEIQRVSSQLENYIQGRGRTVS